MSKSALVAIQIARRCLLLAGVLCLPRTADAACRTLRFQLTAACRRSATEAACQFDAQNPDLGPQVAVWIESADRTRFIDTLMVTNAVALYGIGNRPGQWDTRSGPKFPYGRRPMALPVWAHARGHRYSGVLMQDGRETELTGHEGQSSPEPYFCRPMLPTEEVDAITCPSGFFRSDKGKLDSTVVSYYPPRADLLDLGEDVCERIVNHPGGSCNYGDSAMYALSNDVDVVAAATPAFGQTAGGAWVVPDSLPAGDYALLVEVGKEFDGNPAFTHSSVVPSGFASAYGLDGNVGQPSLVYRVPFSLGDSSGAGTTAAAAVTDATWYGDWTGDTGDVHPIDASINVSPGSGAGRLDVSDGPGGSGRVHVSISACDDVDCSAQPALRPVAFDIDAASMTPTHVTINLRQASDNGAAVLGYDVRYQDVATALQTMPLSPADFPRWAAGPFVAPGAPGTTIDVSLDGLMPQNQYAIGVRARGRCQTSEISYVRFWTPKQAYQQLSGCFIATAAFGSNLSGEVEALRRLRDRGVASSALALAAADLYRRSAPAAARGLEQSETARAAVRVLLRPMAALAGAADRFFDLQ